MADELNKFLTSQARLNTLAKEQGKSINLLNVRYKLLNKVLGPFYTKYIDLKNGIETAGDVFKMAINKVGKLGEAFKIALKPLTATLGVFKKIMVIMTFVLGAFALVGGAVFLLTKHFEGGELALSSFQSVIESGKKLLETFKSAFSGIIETLGGLDYESIVAALMPSLEGAMAVLAEIMILWHSLIGAMFEGIGTLVATLQEAGFFQKASDAFYALMAILGAAFVVAVDAIKTIGEVVVKITRGIMKVVNGIISFLFNSGLIDFAITIVKYVVVISGAIVILAGSFIKLFLRVWGQLGPPLIRFVAAFFGFLEPIIRIITGILGLVMEAIMGLIIWLLPYITTAMDGMMVILQPIIDVITFILDGASKALEIGGNLIGGAADLLGFSDGGVATGPTSGYPVALHGTEAVVPLPDGRTIPVSIKGDIGGGGQTNNINISVSGGGNAREIAKAVSDEVSKVLRNRSRGGNFTRGVM